MHPAATNNYPLATSHCLNSSFVPLEHIAHRSMLQSGHNILKNAACHVACFYALLPSSSVKEQHIHALKPNFALPPVSVARSQVDQIERHSSHKLNYKMNHSATFKGTKIVIHPSQPSCDAKTLSSIGRVDQKGYTSQHQGLGSCSLQDLPGCQPVAWVIFWHTHDNCLLHSSIMLAHSKLPLLVSLSLMTCTCMISSTPICSLKFSSQSKCWHPIANAQKYYVSTFVYGQPSYYVPNSSWGIASTKGNIGVAAYS